MVPGRPWLSDQRHAVPVSKATLYMKCLPRTGRCHGGSVGDQILLELQVEAGQGCQGMGTGRRCL